MAVDPSWLCNVDDQKAFAAKIKLPAGLTHHRQQEAANETKAMIAEHQFNAELRKANADFFDTHRAA